MVKKVSFIDLKLDLLLHEQDSHVLHATSISATATVLAVPADSTVTHGYVAPHMSHFPQP